MATITMSQVTELEDPILRGIAQRIALEAKLAAAKVAASFQQPAEYKLTANNASIERILESHFTILPVQMKEKAATNAVEYINAPGAELGDLASIDLRTDKAIEVQVRELPFPPGLMLPPDHPLTIASRRQGGLILRQLQQSKLELRIHKVRCVEETSGFLGTKLGSDEIDLGGTTVDETGDTEKIDPFLVRDDFDDGEEQPYEPPKQFASFDLTEGTEFPKSYFVTLVLAEIDMGGLPEFLDKLVNWAKEEVSKALITAVGGLIGTSGGPIGAAIGAAIGFVVNEVFEYIKRIWEDDTFKPATLRIDIPSYDASWGGSTDSPEVVITYVGNGGEYQVTVDWRLYGAPSPPPLPIPTGIIYAITLPSVDARPGGAGYAPEAS